MNALFGYAIRNAIFLISRTSAAGSLLSDFVVPMAPNRFFEIQANFY
jgi:hypothetical protein